jgi:hypothetical protein
MTLSGALHLADVAADIKTATQNLSEKSQAIGQTVGLGFAAA